MKTKLPILLFAILTLAAAHAAVVEIDNFTQPGGLTNEFTKSGYFNSVIAPFEPYTVTLDQSGLDTNSTIRGLRKWIVLGADRTTIDSGVATLSCTSGVSRAEIKALYELTPRGTAGVNLNQFAITFGTLPATGDILLYAGGWDSGARLVYRNKTGATSNGTLTVTPANFTSLDGGSATNVGWIFIQMELPNVGAGTNAVLERIHMVIN